MSFSFPPTSAFAFIDVKPKNGDLYKIIAYIPKYDPKNLNISGGFPYREKFSGPAQPLKHFRGEVRDVTTYGITPWNLPNEAASANLPKPFRLRFVIPDNACDKNTGTLVGLGEVSDASTTNPLPGALSLSVYRMKEIKIFSSSDIEYANLVYVLTSGLKPEAPVPSKSTSSGAS